MAQLVPEGSKNDPITAFWNFTTSFIWKFITSLDSFTKVFLIISLLVILATPIIVKNRQTINQYASRTNKQCIPLPSCAIDGRCPEILNNEIPNVRWCLPSPTPTPPPFKCGDIMCNSGQLCSVAQCMVVPGGECTPVYTCINPVPSYAPTSAPNIETIIRRVGEQEGSFLIQKINRDSVSGLWYQAYPVATNQGIPKVLHISDDIGYVCEGVSDILTSIDYSGQTVTFTKVTGQPPTGGCPL